MTSGRETLETVSYRCERCGCSYDSALQARACCLPNQGPDRRLAADGGVLNVQIKDAGAQAIVENALDELADEMGKTISRSRGPSGPDEMTRGDAMVELAKRYARDDLEDDQDDETELRADGGTKYATDPGEPPTGWSPGDRARDTKEESYVRVLDVTDTRADEWVIYVTDSGREETVHDYHRGRHPADDEVLVCVFEDALDEYLQVLDHDVDPERVLDVLRALEVDSLEHRSGRYLNTYAYPEGRLEYAPAGEPDAR